MFGFQRLDAYRCAVAFLPFAARLSHRMPRGYAPLGDQLRRAALSISLNIAEGSGRFDGGARHHYAIARGSALECAAVVDAVESMGLAPGEDLAPARSLLERVVGMMTAMTRG